MKIGTPINIHYCEITEGRNQKMPAPKWLVIAKNEYRIRTSSVRRIRPYFPYITIGALGCYILFIAPSFVRLILNDLLEFFLSQVALAVVEIVLFLIFVYFIIIPITSALKEEQTEQLQIFLSAPVKSSDVLLGTFLGSVPLYAILITLIAGSFTALLHPLKLTILQMAITVIVFVVISESALWIGTVIAALLRTRLGRTARGRDIGRALAMILVLPLVAMFYIISYGGLLETLANPEAGGIMRTLLSWLPSSWGAKIIITFAHNPGSIFAAGYRPAIWFVSLVAFFVGVLYLGTKAADRVYRLEHGSFIGSQAHPDGIFYKTVKHLGGGGSFGTLVVSVFKDFSRRLENISNIMYMLGVLSLMIIFVAPTSAGPDEPPSALIMMQFILPIIVVMVTGEVTVRGKESLYLYRKAPSGQERFIKAMLLKSWLMAVPIAGVVTVVITFLTLETAFMFLLTATGLMILFAAGFVVFILGLFLVNPAFTEKSMKLWINIIIAVVVSMGLFIASLLILTRGGELAEPVGGLPHVLLVQTLLCWFLGIVFLYLGKENLKRIE
jgi:hypothetical protein